MAASPSASAPAAARPWADRIQSGLHRLATAAAAVIGLSAMATSASGSTPVLANGIYLYGESSIAETLGAVYVVFEAKDGQLSGAIYQPSSSFDCVRGTVGSRSLDLVITDAYDQSESSYTIAVASNAAVASASGVAAPAQLEGLHAITPLSSLDHQLLATCANR